MSRERWRRAFGLFRTAARRAWRVLALFARILFAIWIQLPRRARLAVLLATLIVLASKTDSIPAVSESLKGLAVLLVAALGFWLIAGAPFRRRS